MLDAGEHAGPVRAHFEVDLLGLELDERVAGGHTIARILVPLHHAGFDD